ncbi:MAG: hypothetical protein F6J99_07740 [Moorea sp. SIO4G3]|nr:hypothetical protein [Moorena sp. SIO4G3]
MQRGLGGNPHERLYQDGSREYGIKILSIPTRIAINPRKNFNPRTHLDIK